MPRIPKVLEKDGVTIISFGREFENIENADTKAIGAVLAETLKKTELAHLAIDLSHTSTCCSMFMGQLIRAWGRLKKDGATRFGLIGLSDEMREILTATQLDELWEQFDSREQLVEEFSTD